MKWMSIGAAVILTSISGVATAQVGPGYPPNHGGMDSKNISVWTNYTDIAGNTTSLSFYVSTFEPKGGIDPPWGTLYLDVQTVDEGEHLQSYGWVSCTEVDPNSLIVNSGRAIIALAVEDLEAAECSGTLTRCEYVEGAYDCDPVAWNVPIEISGEMGNATVLSSGTESSVETNLNFGTLFRYQCSRSSGASPNGGGITFRTVDGNYDYIPFANPYPDDSLFGTAQGNYNMTTCTDLSSNRKPRK